MEMRYGKASIRRSKNLANREAYPRRMEIQVVYVKEKSGSAPEGERPIEWMPYTTCSAENKEGALKIVGYCQSRRLIGDLFRTIRSGGLNYEGSELESGPALRKVFIMSFIAAMRTLQVRQAREGKTEQKGIVVFSKEQLEWMEELSGRYEGEREKQRNPYERENLAWAVWHIARIGGWKGYASQRPPGVLTLHEGWMRFQTIFLGWCAAKNMYKRYVYRPNRTLLYGNRPGNLPENARKAASEDAGEAVGQFITDYIAKNVRKLDKESGEMDDSGVTEGKKAK
jgi:hypothetical protein